MKKIEAFYKNKKVLVTGGAGFIGSHLAQTLCELGAQVTILDDLSTGKLANIKPFCSQISVQIGDVTSFKACMQATENQQIVFHLAALVSVQGSIKQPKLCEKINVGGTSNILDACVANNVKTFVFSSSAAVYGNKKEICEETDKPNPQSPYATSKLAGEQMCKEYAREHGISTAALRYFNVFGPRQDPHSEYSGVVAKFTQLITDERPLVVYGDGKQTRDFIPVANVVEANLLCGMQQNLRGDVFNVATGKSITLLELIKQLEKETQKKCAGITFQPARAGDIISSQARCAKLESLRQNSLS